MDLTLFDQLEPEKKKKLGNADIAYDQVKSILTKASGFLSKVYIILSL